MPREEREAAAARIAALAKQQAEIRRREAALLTSQEVEAETPEDSTADLSENHVGQIMNDQTKSSEEKITAIVDYLTAEGDDFLTARAHFSEFESYFIYLQSERTKAGVKGIEELIEEARSSIKPEIEKIVKDFLVVQQSADESYRLLEVMREARLKGETIDQIGAAIKANDYLIFQIKELSEALERREKNEKRQQDILDAKLKEEEDSRKGFKNAIVRKLLGPDKNIQAAIALAQEELSKARQDLEKGRAELAEKEKQRRNDLEAGPLTILRTIDATEKSFSDNIVHTAETSLDMIEGTASAIARVLKRINYGEEQVRKTILKLAQGQVQEVILKSILDRVKDVTEKQVNDVDRNLGLIDGQLTDSGKTEPELVLLRVDRVDVAQKHHAGRGYLEALNNMQGNFKSVVAEGVASQSRADMNSAVFQAEKDFVGCLGNETLPALACSLHSILLMKLAQQNGEISMSIDEVTRRARKVARSGLDGLTCTQDELHKKEVDRMNEAIAALDAAHEITAKGIENSIKHAAERDLLFAELGEAAEDLKILLGNADRIRGGGMAVPTRPERHADGSATAAKLGSPRAD